MTHYMNELLGGALVGAGSAALLLTQGRVLGVSGISGGLFGAVAGDRQWRLAFLLGLAVVGLVATRWAPEQVGSPSGSMPRLILAGLLVGFGTRLGNGCTSGHGVCGLARGSRRSLSATVVFLGVGMAVATLLSPAGGAQ